MMYDSYQAMADVGDAARLLAVNAERILNIWATGPFASPMRRMAAYYEAVALAGFTHERPSFDLPFVDVRGQSVAVEDEVVCLDRFLRLAALPQGFERRRTESPARRADVGPFRDAAARHAEDDAARS